MPYRKRNIFKRAVVSVADFLIVWWREATGPIRRSRHRRFSGAIARRILLWTPVAVLALIVFSAMGFYAFTSWRARDLTAKALANADAGNARVARLQIFSAMNMRPADPAVRRAAALIESRLGSAAALQMWEEFSDAAALSAEELDACAEVMALHGSDEQFAKAIAALEKSGNADRAAELRSERSLQRGDIEEALAQARAAASAKDAAPRMRLRLLHVLAARHGPILQRTPDAAPRDLAAASEMAQLIDGLLDTPVADEALAFGLQAPYLPADKKSQWAQAAWRNASSSNPALLPAAGFLVVSGAESPEALYNKLNVLYVGAPLPQQAAFAKWMLRRGMNERVLITASAAKAVQDQGIFAARAQALSALRRWDELYKLADSPAKASDTVRLMIKARAAHELGRRGEESELVRKALQGSVSEGDFVQALELADLQGHQALADEQVTEMCGKASTADGAFRLARDRFGSRGQFAKLDAAMDKASGTVPNSPAVADYRRYEDLLAGRAVEPQETAAAVAAEPKSIGPRITHSLALLKAGRSREALSVFDQFDVFVENLPPGQQAVAIAVLAANGQSQVASRLAHSLIPSLLTPGEYALLAPVLMTGRN